MSEESKFLGMHPDVRVGMAKELRSYKPEALACFESDYPEKHANRILAQREWERRFIIETAFWQRLSAWIGVAGVIVGSLITIAGAILLKAIWPD
jgi:hypothetical protein